MKRILKRNLFLVLLGFVLLISNVSAQVYYTNLNGVEMNEIQYAKMTQMFSERRVSSLTQEEFDKYKEAEILQSEVYYEKNTYKDGVIVNTETITEEEYNNAPEDENICTPYSDTYQEIETEYKRFATQFINYNGLEVMAIVSWKKPPKYRSFDVFAMRFQYFNYSGFNATQDYYVGNNYDRIYYDTAAPGYKPQSTGFGVSMNLKDGTNITGYELTMEAKVTVNTTSSALAHAFVTYQHAQTNLTREQSMSYSMDVTGLGNVLYYANTTIRNSYDDMTGLHLVYHLS